jgi:hypothetical protein
MFYAHADLAQKYPVCLQEIFVSRLCSQEENSFFLPWRGASCEDWKTAFTRLLEKNNMASFNKGFYKLR